MRYLLQNRYQDSGWEDLAREQFAYKGEAIGRAADLSRDAICYGMVRVIDVADGRVVVTFAAGGRLVAVGP